MAGFEPKNPANADEFPLIDDLRLDTVRGAGELSEDAVRAVLDEALVARPDHGTSAAGSSAAPIGPPPSPTSPPQFDQAGNPASEQTMPSSAANQPTLPASHLAAGYPAYGSGSAAFGAAAPNAPDSLKPGDAFAEYRLVQRIGSGAFGVVWRAYSDIEDRDVALKILPTALSRDEVEMERVRQCFRTVHHLQHANICPVYRLAHDPIHGYYLVMKFIVGEAVHAWRARKGEHAPQDAVLRLLCMAADALDYAHGQKVVHRDVKPANMLCTPAADDLQLVDFGLAAQIQTSVARVSLVAGPETLGTPAYMSPEACAGLPQDGRSDQYALGCVAYYLLAGRPPFEGSMAVVMNCHRDVQPREIEGLPRGMNAALLKVLAKRPEDRFASCCDFVDALSAAAGDASVALSPARTRPRADAPEFSSSVRLASAGGVAASSSNAKIGSGPGSVVVSPGSIVTKPVELSTRGPWTALVAEELAGEVAALCFAPAGERLLAAFADGGVAVIDPASAKLQKTGAGIPIRWALHTTEGGFAVANPNEIRLIDPQRGRILFRFRPEGATILSLCSTPNRREICCLTDRDQFLFVDMAREKVARTLPAAARDADGLTVDHAGKSLAAAGAEGTRVYPLGGLLRRTRLLSSTTQEPMRAPLFSPDGKRLAVLRGGDALNIYDTKTWEARSVALEARAHGMTFARGGLRLALACNQSRLLFLTLQNGDIQKSDLPAPATHLAISPAGRYAINCGAAGIHVAEPQSL